VQHSSVHVPFAAVNDDGKMLDPPHTCDAHCALVWHVCGVTVLPSLVGAAPSVAGAPPSESEVDASSAGGATKPPPSAATQ
jgi:hypothetical protein